MFAGAGENDCARFGVVAERQRRLLDLGRCGTARWRAQAIESDDGNRPAAFDREVLVDLFALSGR
jgi:hypothetical protein